MPDIESKKLRAVFLLSTGLTQAQVAEELGVSTRTLQRWLKEPDVQTTQETLTADMTNVTVKATIDKISNTTYSVLNYEKRKDLIWKEYEYLETATQSIMGRVAEGDLRAINTLVKLSQRRCELLSLNMPKNDLLNAVILCSQFGLLSDLQSDTFINRISNFFEGGMIDGNYEQSETFEED